MTDSGFKSTAPVALHLDGVRLDIPAFTNDPQSQGLVDPLSHWWFTAVNVAALWLPHCRHQLHHP